MRMAGGYSLFATAQKWKREYKTGSGRRYRNGTDAFGRFFHLQENRIVQFMEIYEELMYNFNVGGSG